MELEEEVCGNDTAMDGIGSFLLIDEQEQIVVDDADQFITHLGCKASCRLKVVSIFGNTGDGKSHTLNHTFFNGEEVFRTSSDQRACTIGIWVAYASDYNALIIDTEGLLGVSDNENRRMRLLLKILALSDVVIYRTRAERLHNDMFHFLDNASSAYWQHFAPELQAALRRNSIGGASLSSLGPSVVIFHETQFTQILGTAIPQATPTINTSASADNQLMSQIMESPDEEVPLSAEEHIQMRFTDLKLSAKAFSCIQYVGTQTMAPPTDFTPLQRRMKEMLGNNSVRAPRTPDVIITGLQTLNEVFSNEIESNRPPLFPDAYFSCQAVCKSCGITCEQSVNHIKKGLPHRAAGRCKYIHDLNNKVLICQKCCDDGIEQVVEPVSWTDKDSAGWLGGIAQYAWSGSVIECPRCGVIYRSREHWYGNSLPQHGAVKMENIHVWPVIQSPKVQHQLSASSYAGRKLLDTLSSVSGSISNVASVQSKQVKEWINNSVLPDYWVPDAEIQFCFVCERDFGKSLSIHHCRACGKGVCESCSDHTLPVPWRGWGDDPVRVCDNCYSTKDCITQTKGNESPKSITSRYISENITHAAGWVGGALLYPSKLMADVTRPEYWVPDDKIKSCCVCEIEFGNTLYKHHCRGCGKGVCEDCSQHRLPVPDKGWDYEVRVCDGCVNTLTKQ